MSADISVLRARGINRGDVSLTLTGTGSKVAMRSPFSLSDDQLEFSDMRIDGGLMSGGGKIAVPLGKGRFAGKAKLDVPDMSKLAMFAGLTGFPASGALSATFGTASGSASEMDFTLEGRSLSLPRGDGQIEADRVLATGSLSGLAGDPSGTVQLTAEELRIDGRRVRQVTAKVDLASDRSIGFRAGLRGLVDPAGTLDLAGRLERGAGRTDILISELDGLIGRQRLVLGKATGIFLSGDATRIEIPELRIGEGTVRVSASMAGESLKATASFTKIPLALVDGLGILPVSAGTLDGSVRIDGAAGAPDMDIEARIAGLSIAPAGAGALPVLAAEATAGTRGGVLTVRAAISAPELPPVTLSGTAGSAVSGVYAFADSMPVDFRILGSGPLAPLVAAFLPDGDQGDGTIEIDLALGGTVAAPDLSGTLNVTGIGYESRAAGTIVKAANLSLKGKGRTVEIVRLAGTDGGEGTFDGRGTFALSPSGALDGSAELSLSRFRAARRDDAIADISGKLRLAASARSLDVSGKVTVDQADILIPEKLPDAIHEIEVEEIRNGKPVGRKKEKKDSDGAIPVNLALSVAIPGRVFVRGRGLQSEWKGNLDISGTAATPGFAGELVIVNGTFAFAGKRFAIREGTITVPPGAEPDPRLHVVAEASAGDILARVTIDGPASAPRFSFSSEPSLPREEVLSWILFGKSSAHLSPIQAAQLAESAATISGATGSGGLFDRMRRATGLDVLDVESGGDSPTGSTLKAGKYISDGVFVSAGQGIAPGSGKVGVEIEVAPYLSIETEAGSNADSSIGVNLKYDF